MLMQAWMDARQLMQLRGRLVRRVTEQLRLSGTRTGFPARRRT